MTASVEVDTSAFDAALARFVRAAKPAISNAGLDTAETVAGRTRGSVPRRSGRLAGSVRAQRVGDDSRVVMGAPYAGWIEYGGTRGRPYVSEGRYLGPASRDADRVFARDAETVLERLGRSL